MDAFVSAGVTEYEFTGRARRLFYLPIELWSVSLLHSFFPDLCRISDPSRDELKQVKMDRIYLKMSYTVTDFYLIVPLFRLSWSHKTSKGKCHSKQRYLYINLGKMPKMTPHFIQITSYTTSKQSNTLFIKKTRHTYRDSLIERHCLCEDWSIDLFIFRNHFPFPLNKMLLHWVTFEAFWPLKSSCLLTFSFQQPLDN